MKRMIQAACVAGAVVLSAAGCSNCCGSRSTSASCPDGACAPGVAGVNTAPTTIGAPPPGAVRSMPATGQKLPGY